MATHLENRKLIIKLLKEELVGPSPQGKEIDSSGEISFDEAQESYGPWLQQGSGEEILLRDNPAKRYGVGVLYPLRLGFEKDLESTEPQIDDIGPSEEPGENLLTEKGLKTLEAIEKRSELTSGEKEFDDLDLSTANAYLPSSMGISFLAGFPEGSSLSVEASGGIYRKKIILVQGKERTWWLRKQISLTAKFSAADILIKTGQLLRSSPVKVVGVEGLDIRIEVFSRPHQGGGEHARLLTVSLVNRTEASGLDNEKCLFQSHFRAYVATPALKVQILPYPKPPEQYLDEEERSLDLLYREAETYAVGHGCAADWGGVDEHLKAEWVSAECLPMYETPSITPEIVDEDGTIMEVPMAPLAGLIPGDDGFKTLLGVINHYEKWIQKQEGMLEIIDERFRLAAAKNIQECNRCLHRIKNGFDYLRGDRVAQKAFSLANKAVLLQQIRSRREPRKSKI